MKKTLILISAAAALGILFGCTPTDKPATPEGGGAKTTTSGAPDAGKTAAPETPTTTESK